MRAAPRLLPPRSQVQTACGWALVCERFASAATLPLGAWGYRLALAALGLALFWPRGAGRGRGAGLHLASALAALFALGVAAWHGLWAGWSAGPLPTWAADWGPWLLLAAVLLLDPPAVRRVARLAGIEAHKLARSRLVRLGALASVAITLLSGWTHTPLPNETGWSLAAAMGGAGFAAAQVFVLVAGATAIAGEASQGTLKMVLPHAYRRSDWVLAKAIALGLVALLLALGVAVSAFAWVGCGDGFGDVLLKAEGFGGEPLVTVHATAAAMRSHLEDALLAETLALLATGMLGLVVSCALTNVVGALCGSFLLFAALRLGDLVLALDAETLHRLFTWAPERLRELVTKLGQGLSEGWDERLPTASLLLSAASAALCVLGGMRALARRDLHV